MSKWLGLTSLALTVLLSAALLGPAHSAQSPSAAPPKNATFRQEFAGRFLIGTALNIDQIMGRQTAVLEFVAAQFNAVTAENEMKWERIHPEENRYHWEVADALVAFCTDNDIFLTGHTLIWHQQTPDWVFEDEHGNPASRELLLKRMQTHIHTVIGHFDGAVPSWDVVNEALNDDGSMRESRWQQIIGDDFVAKAFEFAHQADPDTRLYYNDYNIYMPAKRDAAVRLVKSLQDQGIRVDGIGMQGHYGLDHPENLDEIEAAIVAYAELGDVMITELDLSVLPFPDDSAVGADLDVNMQLKALYNPYTEGLSSETEKAQTERYLDIFKIFLKHQDKISRVTFWGLSDADSWKNGWPMQGRTDYPLMINREMELKPAALELFQLTDDYPLPVN